MSKRKRAEKYVGNTIRVFNDPYRIVGVEISKKGDIVIGARNRPELCFRLRTVGWEESREILIKVSGRLRYEIVSYETAYNEIQDRKIWILFAWLGEFIEIMNDVDDKELNRRVASMREGFRQRADAEPPKMEYHLRPFAALARAVLVQEYRAQAN